MMRFVAFAGLFSLCAAYDLTAFYDGWNQATGLKSSFTDKLEAVLTKGEKDLKRFHLSKPVVSFLETGQTAAEGQEMSASSAHKLLHFLKPIKDAAEALEMEAMSARAMFGWSMGGHGLPHSGDSQGRAVWEAFIKSEMPKEEPKFAGSFLESSSMVQVQTESVSEAVMNQRLAAGAKKMRTEKGRAMLQFADMMAQQIERDAKEAEEAVHNMMDKLMTMSLKERKPLMKEYERLKREAAMAKQAHDSMDGDVDQVYQTMAKFPDEELMNPKDIATDNTIDAKMEEMLLDPKVQSMMQMSQEGAPSSFMQASAESTHMTSLSVTAEGRVGKTGIEEEGTEEQGAAQAAELLKMFDQHVGFYGSAPKTISSFLQTHEKLSNQERQESQSKALLERRCSKAASRSAQIDKLLDDAIMAYLSNPTDVEDKPSILEEIAGAFHSNTDPLGTFNQHPFVLRYQNEQQKNAVVPSKHIQKELTESLLKEAPDNMKMAMIHVDLSVPGTRDLKIQQDMICMKQALMKMKKSDIDAGGKDADLKVFIDVEGAADHHNDRVQKQIQRSLEDVIHVSALNKLGDQDVQDYVVGLSDFVFRIGEGELADSHNLDLAAFKTEALRHGGVIRADVTKPPADMCTLDNENLEVATTKAYEKFKRINKIVEKVETGKKEQKMLSATERWAEQQRRVETKHKRHGKASVDVDFKPAELVKGFANLLQKGGRTANKASRASAFFEDSDNHGASKRHGPNFGLYMPRSRMV